MTNQERIQQIRQQRNTELDECRYAINSMASNEGMALCMKHTIGILQNLDSQLERLEKLPPDAPCEVTVFDILCEEAPQ